MKKWVILGLITISSGALFAQNSNLKKAKNNYSQYEKLGGAEAGELATKFLKESTEAIDEATTHEKTKDNPETWTIYSLIYSNLAFAETNAEYAQKAATGIAQAKTLDEAKKEHANNINVAEVTLRNYYYNAGGKAWEAQNFQGAYDAFNSGLVIFPSDTTLTYYSAMAAIQTKDYPNAIKKYEELLAIKEHSAHKTIAADLPKLYLSPGVNDTTKAIEAAAQAAQLYPDDNDIVTQNIELNLIAGNEQKIIKDIEDQIAKDPNNKTLHYYLGIAASSADDFVKAQAAYRKALEIDPNYGDAEYNLASVIINQSRQELMDLNAKKDLPNSEYIKALDGIKAKMAETVPYLERAIERDAKNVRALSTLKSYYDFIQDETKSTEIQAKIDAVK